MPEPLKCCIPDCTEPAAQPFGYICNGHDENNKPIWTPKAACAFHKKHPGASKLCPVCLEQGIMQWIQWNSKGCRKHRGGTERGEVERKSYYKRMSTSVLRDRDRDEMLTICRERLRHPHPTIRAAAAEIIARWS